MKGVEGDCDRRDWGDRLAFIEDSIRSEARL
jgi:hypothetical protein